MSPSDHRKRPFRHSLPRCLVASLPFCSDFRLPTSAFGPGRCAIGVALAVMFLLPGTAALAGDPGAAGDLYVSDWINDRVVQFDGASGAYVGDFVPSPSGGLDSPYGLTFGPNGNLFVSSKDTDEVIEYDGTTGAPIGTFASGGGLDSPMGLTFGPNGNLFVASKFTNSVIEYDGATGTLIGTFASGGGLYFPYGLTFGPNGNLFVVSEDTDEVIEYDGTTGAPVGTFATGGGLLVPYALTFGPNGNLFVSSYGTGSVIEYDGATGDLIGTFTGGGPLNGSGGLAFGPDGSLLVAGCSTPRDVFQYYGDSGGLVRQFAGGFGRPIYLTFKALAGPFPQPTLTGFAPSQVDDNCLPLVGATVTGTGLVWGAQLSLTRAGEPDVLGAITALTPDTQFTASFDMAGAAAGFWDLVVSYPDDQTATLTGALEIATACPPPTVTDFDPATASNCGVLTGAIITGTGFVAVPWADVKLTMAGEADIIGTSVDVQSSTTIVADFDLTAAAVGFWDVTVTNPGGSGSGTLVDALEVMVCPPPTVTDFTPAQADYCGPLAGATITGSNFTAGTAVKLTMAGEADIVGTDVDVQSTTTIVADFDLTAAATGFWDVVVTRPDDESATLAAALEVTPCPPPVVTGFTPDTDVACQHWLRGSISNQNIVEGVEVRLTKEGEADMVGKLITHVFPLDPIIVDFWVNKATGTGAWDLVVTNPDGQSGTLAGAITIAADPDCPFGAVGDLYIAERQIGSKVMQFDGVTGDTVGDFICRRCAGLNYSSGLAFMPNGNMLVTTYNPSGVLEFGADTGALIGEFVPVIDPASASSANGWLAWPTDAVLGPDGDLYLTSRDDGFVNRYDGQTGEWLGFFAIGGPGPGLDDPLAMRFGPNGNLFVAYGGLFHWLRPAFYGLAEFHGATGRLVRAISFGGGMDSGTAIALTGLEFSPEGDLLVIEQEWPTSYPRYSLRSEVVKYDFETAEPLGTLIPHEAGGIWRMNRLTYAPNGNLFVNGNDDGGWGMVVEFDPFTGEPIGTFAYPGPPGQDGMGEPRSMAFRPEPQSPLPSPSISGVSVAQVDACEGLTGVTVSGSNLDAAATTVKLSRTGGEPPYPDYVGLVTGSSGDGTSLTVDFDLDGGVIASGLWDVVALNPDGQADTLVGAVQMVGCRAARAGNLLASASRSRFNHRVTGIIEYDGPSGDVVGWFAADRMVSASELQYVNGMEYGPNGNLFVAADWPGADPDARYVIEFDAVTGQRLGEFVPEGSGGLLWPYDLTFGPDGNLFVLHHTSYPPWLSDAGILEFDGLTGAFVRTVVPIGACGLSHVSKLTFGPDGNLYLSTELNGVIKIDAATGACLGTFVPPPPPEAFPRAGFWPGLAFSPHTGNLLVNRRFLHPDLPPSNGVVNEILEYDGDTGGFLRTFVEPEACGLAGGPTSPGRILYANGMVFGPDGNLYVSSWSRADEAEVLWFDGWTGDDCGSFAFHRFDKSAIYDIDMELAFVPLPGDGDGDWDVDLDDFARLQQCFGSGVGGATPDDYWCLRFDFDRDGDVDADDLPGFARELTGANN